MRNAESEDEGAHENENANERPGSLLPGNFPVKVRARVLLQRRRRQSELEGGEGEVRRRRIASRRQGRDDIRPTARRALTGQHLVGAGDRAPETLRQSGDDPPGERADVRANGWRGGGDVIGAQRRRHRQHCQNLSMPACQRHRYLILGHRNRPAMRRGMNSLSAAGPVKQYVPAGVFAGRPLVLRALARPGFQSLAGLRFVPKLHTPVPIGLAPLAVFDLRTGL